MQNRIEELFINKFVVKDKRERYLGFLSKEKSRRKFTKELFHFKDLEWKLFREITGKENEREVIRIKIKGKKHISACYVISSDSDHDGKLYEVDSAIENIVGKEGIILIFGDADTIYYEGEAFEGRFISL